MFLNEVKRGVIVDDTTTSNIMLEIVRDERKRSLSKYFIEFFLVEKQKFYTQPTYIFVYDLASHTKYVERDIFIRVTVTTTPPLTGHC